MKLERLCAAILCALARTITGARAIWQGCPPDRRRRIYFANHSSHIDFLLTWAALPPVVRAVTRPVAGSDYWLASPLRRFIACRVFRSVLVDRRPGSGGDAVARIGEALAAGDSLIFFPEGTRNTGEELLPFKSGLFHLARSHQEVELVPVWIENLGRVMPKGSYLPVPLLCTLTFGTPLRLEPGETKVAFLNRSREALQATAGHHC